MINPLTSREGKSISAVICTMARPDDLRKTLESLRACEPVPDEILVSDDSPPDDDRSETVCGSFDEVRYQRATRRGLSANRNAALLAARSNWVHYLDDDVLVPRDFYAKAHAAIDRSPRQSIVSGFEWKHPPATSGPAVKVDPPRVGFWTHMRAANDATPTCVVMNAALFPRELLARVGFDERMRYGCEESDVSMHALSLGYKLFYDPQLFVNHYPSALNRESYQAVATASAVYAGLKRQWVYMRSPVGTLLFGLLAIPRMWCNHIRRHGVRVVPESIRQSAIGVRHFLDYCSTRRTVVAGWPTKR